MTSPRLLVVYDKARESEARALQPEAAARLDGSALADILEVWNRGFDLVLPLPEVDDGTLQGSLEFLGLPFAGPTLTEAILSNDASYLGAEGAPSASRRPLEALVAEALERQRENDQLLSTFRDRL